MLCLLVALCHVLLTSPTCGCTLLFIPENGRFLTTCGGKELPLKSNLASLLPQVFLKIDSDCLTKIPLEPLSWEPGFRLWKYGNCRTINCKTQKGPLQAPVMQLFDAFYCVITGSTRNLPSSLNLKTRVCSHMTFTFHILYTASCNKLCFTITIIIYYSQK